MISDLFPQKNELSLVGCVRQPLGNENGENRKVWRAACYAGQ